jgi:3-deoxy-D-manno-octulosonate 8-phosphate phosphatase KdsC-like HAD superfamily phosphatase
MEPDICQHLQAIKTLKVEHEHVCEDCIKTGDEWLHLRTCQTCGVTLCCNDSPNQHMQKHYHKTKHPVISSAEPGERWLWCNVDEMMVEY